MAVLFFSFLFPKMLFFFFPWHFREECKRLLAVSYAGYHVGFYYILEKYLWVSKLVLDLLVWKSVMEHGSNY